MITPVYWVVYFFADRIICRRSIDCIIPVWNSDTLDDDSYSFQLVRYITVDRVGEQSSHRTEEDVAVDVVDVVVDPAECGEVPGGLPRGAADAADVGDRPADVDGLDRLAAQRALSASQDRDVVAAVDECPRDRVLLAVRAARAHLDPHPTYVWSVSETKRTFGA